MKLFIKLFLMTHYIPIPLHGNEAMLFYKTVAKLHGMSVRRSFYGFVLS